jgi:DNA-binding CsgD family transcriptional regulator
MLQQKIGDVGSVLDVLTQEEWVNNQLYLEWAKPQGIVDAVQVTVDRSATGLAVFGIARHESVGITDDATRHALTLLFPHVRRAVLIGRVIDLHKVEAAALADTLDGLAAGLFLIDREGRIVHANAAASEMLDAGSPARRSGDRLALATTQADQAWREALLAIEAGGEAALDGRGASIPILSRDGDPHVAHVLPLRAGARLQDVAANSAIAAVFLRKVALDRATALDAITRLYGLTPMEARVLGAIVEIGGVPAVAKAFGNSESTVKTHLKRVFEKTGIQRQADLASLVAGLTSPFEPRS